jgi:PilZ domain-containing protein
MIPAPPREKRLYTRYPFEAHAEIIASDVELPLRVTNISFGGCRLLTNGLIPEGSTITIRIRTQTDSFMATAKVMHSTEDDVGVMLQLGWSPAVASSPLHSTTPHRILRGNQ